MAFSIFLFPQSQSHHAHSHRLHQDHGHTPRTSLPPHPTHALDWGLDSVPRRFIQLQCVTQQCRAPSPQSLLHRRSSLSSPCGRARYVFFRLFFPPSSLSQLSSVGRSKTPTDCPKSGSTIGRNNAAVFLSLPPPSAFVFSLSRVVSCHSPSNLYQITH